MRRWILHVWVMLLVVVSISPASGAETGVVLRVGVETRDGSYLLGQPAFSNLAIRTSYADLQMGLEHISGVALTGNEGEASVSLRNGDKVKGVLGTREIKIEGLLGLITVRQDQIAAIRVMRGGGGLGGRLREGLLLHYTFDSQDKLATDSGPGQQDGTVHGAKYSANGRDGGAAEFDGRSSHIRTPVVDNTKELTWAIWVYPRSLIGSDRIVQMVGLKGQGWVWNSCNTSMYFCMEGEGGWFDFYIQGPTGAARAAIKRSELLNQWTHVACTVDGEGWHTYINGRPAGNRSESTRIGSPCAMIIGANDNGPQRYFDGFMDELMVFDRALSADEMQQLYESQK